MFLMMTFHYSIHTEPVPQVSQLPAKEDIQRQQADLQAKILSLLGSSAVVPPSPSQQPLSSQGRGYDQGNSMGNSMGNSTMGNSRGLGGGQYGGRGFGGMGATGNGGGRGFGQGGYGSGY